MNGVLLFFLVFFISSCAGSPARIALLPKDEIKKVSSFDLCNAYAFNGHSSVEIKDELVSRGEINYLDWSDIDNGRIRVGMSELGLICSMGKPGPFGGVNRSFSQGGEGVQYFYRSNTRGKTTQVFVANGIISSYQQ